MSKRPLGDAPESAPKRTEDSLAVMRAAWCASKRDYLATLPAELCRHLVMFLPPVKLVFMIAYGDPFVDALVGYKGVLAAWVRSRPAREWNVVLTELARHRFTDMHRIIVGYIEPAPSPLDAATLQRCANGHISDVSIVARIIDDSIPVPRDMYMQWEQSIARQGHDAALARVLATMPLTDNAFLDLLCLVIGSGSAAAVEVMLADPRSQPAICNGGALVVAAEMGKASIAERLLVEPGIAAAANRSAALRIAAEYGHVDVLNALLAHPRPNPATSHNEPLYTAAQNGRANIVKILLADERVDPRRCGGKILLVAINNERLSVVEALLADGRIDPTTNDNEAIKATVCQHRTTILDMLLADGRADPTVNDNEPLRRALRMCTRIYPSLALAEEMRNLLLADPRVNPTRLATAEEWLAANPLRRVLRRRKQ
jgi:hypothetical protein